MVAAMAYQPTVMRTGRGLTIAGTRITLYQIIDFLKAGYPPEEIRGDFGLTARQMKETLSYIETHRAEVEQEYEQVLRLAESNRQYWLEHNRERLAKIAQMGPKPEQAELWSRLEAWKARLAQEEQHS